MAKSEKSIWTWHTGERHRKLQRDSAHQNPTLNRHVIIPFLWLLGRNFLPLHCFALMVLFFLPPVFHPHHYPLYCLSLPDIPQQSSFSLPHTYPCPIPLNCLNPPQLQLCLLPFGACSPSSTCCWIPEAPKNPCPNSALSKAQYQKLYQLFPMHQRPDPRAQIWQHYSSQYHSEVTYVITVLIQDLY